MKTETKNFVKGTFFGIFICLAVISAWTYFPLTDFLRSGNTQTEIPVDQAITRIKNREVKEAVFKAGQIDLVDKNGNEFFAMIGSDPTRELFSKEVNAVNERTPGFIKITEESVSSNWNWFVFTSLLSLVTSAASIGILIFLALIYKRTSANKS